ncbi:MAG: 50S ribosomal protein L20, partial [Burkholderiales bacterium]|nr:50S ribosomal protein L20 [Burkholderiales bacterium]
MKLTPEHQQISDTVTRFIEKEVNPHVPAWEAAEQYPAHEVFKKLGNLGLLGIKYPEEFGGLGLDFSYSMVMAEALGSCHCGGVPMSIGVQTDMCTPALARFGSDELRREFLTPSIAGDLVGCIGVSEPGGGSDVAAVKTNARVSDGDYLINGTKMWITNGLQADWCCLLANTSDGPAHKNKSLIMVPMDAKGISKQKIRKMLRRAKGFRAGRSKLNRAAREAVMRAGQYGYFGRKNKKRDYRGMWIVRINAACD